MSCCMLAVPLVSFPYLFFPRLQMIVARVMQPQHKLFTDPSSNDVVVTFGDMQIVA